MVDFSKIFKNDKKALQKYRKKQAELIIKNKEKFKIKNGR